jgi:RHS repeat-associated protein
VTSAIGALQLTFNYEPFGAARPTGTRPTAGAPTSPIQFSAAYRQADGKYYTHARSLDPGTGRFNAKDPAAGPDAQPAFSRQSYVDNRPTSMVDPSGQFALSAIGAIGGAVVGGITGGVSNTIDFGITHFNECTSGAQCLHVLEGTVASGLIGGASGAAGGAITGACVTAVPWRRWLADPLAVPSQAH